MTRAQRPVSHQIGLHRLDLEQGVLVAPDGLEIVLRPKSFALLCLLAENMGRIMSSEAIMDAVWPDSFVTQNNVNQCVLDIRRALGEDCALMLRTFARRGFGLIPPAAGASVYSFDATGMQLDPATLFQDGHISAADAVRSKAVLF